jgi:large subunit ribosomal protein L29
MPPSAAPRAAATRRVVNKMKANEVKKLNDTELEEKLTGLKKDLFFLRMQHATNQLDNPIKISQVKKDIARVKTVIRQKQLGL